jgi:hypothetical protein
MARSSKGGETDRILRNIQHLFKIRKMRLDIDSVDAPIGNYYIYTLMQANRTMDEGSWYTTLPNNKGTVGNGMIELALTILDKVSDVNYSIDKQDLTRAINRTGLLGEDNIVDLRFTYMKILLEIVEMYRKIIYEEKK